MIYGPATDISDQEAEMITEYVEGGGKLLVMAGPSQESGLETLYSLISDYGVQVNEGIVVEGDREHYAFQSPWHCCPIWAAARLPTPWWKRTTIHLHHCPGYDGR